MPILSYQNTKYVYYNTKYFFFNNQTNQDSKKLLSNKYCASLIILNKYYLHK